MLIYFFVFLIGACWGSFLNCLIYRWEQGEKLNRGRSFCPQCKHQLGFWDLVPIFSFVFLKQKCRYCRKKISWQYLAAEIATGLIFLLIFNFKNWIELFYYWFVVSCLIIIFIYDAKHYIIPDRAIYPAIGVVFLYQLFGNYGQLLSFLAAAGAAAGFFFIIWLASKGRAMGFGDVKLAFFMGLFLGFPNVILALFTAFLTGAAVGVVLLLLGRKKMRSQVPFGPFLIGGVFAALFFGERIISWYLSLLG